METLLQHGHEETGFFKESQPIENQLHRHQETTQRRHNSLHLVVGNCKVLRVSLFEPVDSDCASVHTVSEPLNHVHAIEDICGLTLS